MYCSVEQQARGWVTALLTAVPGSHFMPQQRDLQTGAIILLTSQKPPARQVLDWLSRGLAAAAAHEGSASCQQESTQGQPAAASGAASDTACRTRSPSPVPGNSDNLPATLALLKSHQFMLSLRSATLLERHHSSNMISRRANAGHCM